MNTPVGRVPESDSAFTSKFRKHQGWWHKFVLNERQGKYFDKRSQKQQKVCNWINDGEIVAFKKNFLSQDIANAVEESLNEQRDSGKGIIEIDRLYNNLLSSQLIIQVLSEPEFDFIRTGLFSHHEDKKTIDAGYEFRKKIGNREDDFIVMPYSHYFERMLNSIYPRRG